MQVRNQLFVGLTDATSRRKMASAIYEVVYQKAADESASNTTNTTNNFPYSFVWNVAVELVCALKADALGEEEGDMAGWGVSPQNWWFARSSTKPATS